MNVDRTADSKKPIKVLYLASGLPHYFNLVLNKINATPGVELVAVVPKGRSRFIGDGVYETREGVNFRVIERKEYAVGRICISFRGLSAILLKERPGAILLPENLAFAFVLHPGLWLLRKLLRTSLVLKSIPFRLLNYPTALQKTSAGRGNITPSSLAEKIVAAMGGMRIIRRVFLELRRHLLRTADAHVNYIDAARELLGSYGVSSERIFVTRNSPDTDALVKTERTILASASLPRRSPFRLLHVGRLVPEKGVDLLLKALSEVCSNVPQTELIVVGGGPEKERFEELTAQLDLARTVRFVGPLYDPVQLGREFMSSSIFVLPGLGGLSINEAMFYGQAVVCSVGDGTERHLVREGYNGAFFRENDSASLAAVLIRLLADPQELARMGERSRAIIDNEVNIHTVVAEYIRAIRYAQA